ncbi:hypothetical protein V2J09_004079 [Rumex salicifolius]
MEDSVQRLTGLRFALKLKKSANEPDGEDEPVDQYKMNQKNRECGSSSTREETILPLMRNSGQMLIFMPWCLGNRTISLLNGSVSSGQNIFMFILGFLETFIGSLSAGLNIDKYMLTEGLGLSGIVSILFTGIVMKHYAYSNLSERSQQFVSEFFHLISSLAETFIFIYMGLDIVMEQHNWSHIGFIFFSIVSFVVNKNFTFCVTLVPLSYFAVPEHNKLSRYLLAANVFSCGYLVNLVRPVHRKIPMKHQKALWYSGLRGAMAFALALQSLHDLPEGHGQTIFTATTSIVVLTVLLIGGSTGTMLEALEVVGDDHEVNLGEEVYDINNGYIPTTSQEDDMSSSGSRFKMRLKEFRQSTSSFTTLDKNYLTPFFTTQNSDDEEDEPFTSSRRENFRN